MEVKTLDKAERSWLSLKETRATGIKRRNNESRATRKLDLPKKRTAVV